MSTNEIPNDLLVELVNLLGDLDDRYYPNCDDVVLTIKPDYMEQLMPLIKWLQYICATWGARDAREDARIHRFCTAADLH